MARRGSKRKHIDSPAHRTLRETLIGRSFVHPLFDYGLIGGAVSLMFTILIVSMGTRVNFASLEGLSYVILLSNSAHFAASTVRLYTKPGAYDTLPLLTMAFPLITAVVLTLCMWFPTDLGPHLQSLYLTWSPYHYAAQAYGLAVMYCYRSGCMLSPWNKRLLWWVSMLAFFYAFVSGSRTGLEWLLPGWIQELPNYVVVQNLVASGLKVLAYAAPLVLFAITSISKEGPMPSISLLTIVTNSIWWILLPAKDAFVWATIFHGIQYLAIVIIFHLKDQANVERSKQRGTAYHVAWFYGACVLVGYALFNCVPFGFRLFGFGTVESNMLVVATINIHHFIVDGYIWRLKKGDGNRRIVVSGEPSAVPVS